jgi:hypothetical protein
MKFERYQHIEKLISEEVEGILDGEVLIFPKLDGANGSVWLDSNGVTTGSRNRTLGGDAPDNQGFDEFVQKQESFKEFFNKFPDWRLYGEWLVPHTFKGYRKDAWRKFYVFDVMKGEEYVSYHDYYPVLLKYEIPFIPCQKILRHPNEDMLIHEANQSNFLCEDGRGPGEGIVIKRYSFKNKYNRVKWAKLVRTEFKDKHMSTSDPAVRDHTPVEATICDKYYTAEIAEKVFANMQNDERDWTSSRIPELLGRVWKDFFEEELWTAIKKEKNPTVDFARLNRLVIAKTKEHLPQVF